MASYHISPMGDPVLASAVSNLAQIFAPKAATRAAGELAGAKVRSETALADAREYQNEQVRGLAQVFAENPQLAAVLGAGQGNAQQMAAAIGAFQEQRLRQQAADAAARGDYTGANAPLFGVASGPVAVNQIQGGYQLNPYVAGGDLRATGKTLAEIVTEEARAAAQRASAAQSYASAAAASALADMRRDQMANPGKYRAAGGGAPLDISPQDAVVLDKLVGQMVPAGAEFPDDVRNDVLTRAAQLYQQTRNAQQSVADAFAELADVEPAVDTPWYNPFTRDKPAQVVRRGTAAAPAPAQAAAPQRKPVPKIPPSQYQAAIAAAERAIKNGADPDAVRQRLIDMGVPLQGDE